MKRALARFESQAQLVLYPVAFSEPSEIATQAALCAGEQGKFWEFHDMLYARQASWYRLTEPLPRLLELSQGLGVDRAALEACVESGRMRHLVEDDRSYARSLQVRSTPTLFINDTRMVGAQAEGDLVRVIRQKLQQARRTDQ